MAQQIEGLGERLKTARTESGISQRELARRLGVSPSLISQLEKDLSKPSVGTLYAIVTELGVSVDSILRGPERPNGGASAQRADEPQAAATVVHTAQRHGIDLSSGVRWERLIPDSESSVDFIHAIYEVGGSSSPDESMMRHHGREYGFVISGRLGVQIGDETYVLEPGDSIGYHSTEGHRLYNAGDETVHAVFLVLDRDSPAADTDNG